MIEGVGGHRLILRVERAQTFIEVRAHDPIGPSEALERVEPKAARLQRALLVPEPRHDQLEKRRLDSLAFRGAAVCCDGALALLADLHGSRPHLTEDTLDRAGLDLDGVGVLGVVPSNRAFDRGTPGRPVEVTQPEQILEHARHPALEPVKPGERVLTKRDQVAHGDVFAGHRPDQLVPGRPLSDGLSVIQKPLLELVEDHEQARVDSIGAAGECVIEVRGVIQGRRASAGGRNGRRNGLSERRDRIVLPPAVERDGELRSPVPADTPPRLLMQRREHPGPQN